MQSSYAVALGVFGAVIGVAGFAVCMLGRRAAGDAMVMGGGVLLLLAAALGTGA